jgi:hypothetical protein
MKAFVLTHVFPNPGFKRLDKPGREHVKDRLQGLEVDVELFWNKEDVRNWAVHEIFDGELSDHFFDALVAGKELWYGDGDWVIGDDGDDNDLEISNLVDAYVFLELREIN